MTGYQKTLEAFRALEKKNFDLVLRTFTLPPEGVPCAVCFFEEMVDKSAVSDHILSPILQPRSLTRKRKSEDLSQRISDCFLEISDFRYAPEESMLMEGLFHGKVIFLCDGIDGGYVIALPGGDKRTPSEPVSDRTISGPKEGFVESLSVNLSLIRRKIADPCLRVEKIMCGSRTQTAVALLYIQDLAEENTVTSVRHALDSIDIDGIFSAGFLAQLTEKNVQSLFPTYRTVERTDIAVAALLEGRVLLLCDQSPLAVSVPTLLAELLQSGEDYYEKHKVGSYIRVLRWICFILSISLPSVYIALVSFRPEILPFSLLAAISSMRAEVPFPALIEILLVEFAVSIIVESSLRLPAPLGQTIGVVSGIIVGQAIISAKLATPSVLIVVAMANICNFAIPNYSLSQSARILRPMMIFPSAVLGLYGFSVSWVFLMLHLLSLESFGVSYLAPFSPNHPEDKKDGFIRVPLTEMINRPFSISRKNRIRQKRSVNK